jgi:hypothetical protein
MPLADAQNLRGPSHDRLEAHAAWNASVANRAKNPVITFGRRMGAKPAISPTPPVKMTSPDPRSMPRPVQPGPAPSVQQPKVVSKPPAPKKK